MFTRASYGYSHGCKEWQKKIVEENSHKNVKSKQIFAELSLKLCHVRTYCTVLLKRFGDKQSYE